MTQPRNAATLSPAYRVVRGTLDGTASRGEHRHAEAEATLYSGEKGRDWRGGKQSRKEHSRPQQPCAREDEENETRDEWSRSALAHGGSRRLQKLPIRHSARTYRLARPAPETLIDVLLNARIVRRHRSFEQRPHEKDSPARTVVLVLEIQISRARLQTESAVHARVDAGQRVRERSARQGTTRHRVTRERI